MASFDDTVKDLREKIVGQLAFPTDHQIAMFRRALDGDYTPDQYVKDMSQCWADGMQAFAGLASGWVAMIQALANEKPKK